MSNRVNSYSMYKPDAYGNPTGLLAPPGTVNPSKSPLYKKKAPASNGYNGQPADAVRQEVSQFKPIEKPVERLPGVEPNEMFGGASNALAAGQAGKATGVKGAGGMAAGAAVAGVAGSALSNNKQEVAGGILKGAGTGASVGAAAGSVVPVIGNVVGGAIGAVVGGIAGGIMGNKKKKTRLRKESKEELNRQKYNDDLVNMQNQSISQAEDLARYNNIVSTYKQGGVITYKTGGLIKYSTLDVDKAKAYLSTLEANRNKESGSLKNTPIVKLQMGGPIENNTTNLMAAAYEMYKKGATPKDIATKFKLDSATIERVMSNIVALNQKNKGTNPNPNNMNTTQGVVSKFEKGGPIFDFTKSSVEMFRRGGPIDVKKQNVIIDGPSHDEKNNTGVAKDKGLPVVKNGEKVAEIESKELVINAEAAKKIVDLSSKAKTDEGAKKELAALLEDELGNNTYDYNKEL
jgi:hypothetical protein